MMENSALIAAGVVGHLMCSVLAYGITFAYFQGEFPELAEKQRLIDRIFSVVVAVFGPIGLLTTYIWSDFAKHGWRA